jgi:hypothetical protein
MRPRCSARRRKKVLTVLGPVLRSLPGGPLLPRGERKGGREVRERKNVGNIPNGCPDMVRA